MAFFFKKKSVSYSLFFHCAILTTIMIIAAMIKRTHEISFL